MRLSKREGHSDLLSNLPPRKRRGTHDREEWLNEVVKKSGWEVVSSELPLICADLIEEAKERLSDG